MAWYKVAEGDELSHQFIKKAKAGNHHICLIKINEGIFATQLKCPHAGGDLHHGWCEDGKLVCPLHRYTYNLHTGKGSEGQGDYIDTYKVKVTDNEIWVRVDSFMDRLKKFFS